MGIEIVEAAIFDDEGARGCAQISRPSGGAIGIEVSAVIPVDRHKFILVQESGEDGNNQRIPRLVQAADQQIAYLLMKHYIRSMSGDNSKQGIG